VRSKANRRGNSRTYKLTDKALSKGEGGGKTERSREKKALGRILQQSRGVARKRYSVFLVPEMAWPGKN